MAKQKCRFFTSRQSIVNHLRIADGLDGVISDIPVPDNLMLTVSSDENRDLALIQLLQQPKFVEFRSIIIYCSRRDLCERVAKNLRTYFQVCAETSSSHGSLFHCITTFLFDSSTRRMIFHVSLINET